MLKLFASACAVSMALSGAAYAANCSNHPYTLTNGTNADANQVMADFNNLLNCGNNNLAPLASPALTGAVTIGSTTGGAESLDIAGTQVLGNSTERLSFNSGSIGFNRRVSTGQIYNTGGYAYQIQHILNASQSSDYLQFQVYAPNGSSVASPLALDALGRVAVNNGLTNASYTFFVNGVSAGTGNWINASDERLKKNVSEISGALDIIMRLRGVRFYWRPTNERKVGANLSLPVNEAQLGFIAQEVEKVVPEAVVKPGRGDASIYGLNQESLIPVLVQAIKEQQAEIEQLRAKVTALSPAGPN